MIKKIIFIIMIITLSISFFNAVEEIEPHKRDTTKDYFIENSVEEVASKNIVTGIYLDYRFFDTIFEASILLVTVSGILYISRFEDF